MKAVLRTLAGVVAGLVVLLLLIVAVELFSNLVHPFPPDFGGTQEEIIQHVERYPTWSLAVVVPAWAMAAYASTWTARRTGNLFASASVGLLLLAGLLCNMSMLPYPTWFEITNLLAIPTAVIAGNCSLNRHQTIAA